MTSSSTGINKYWRNVAAVIIHSCWLKRCSLSGSERGHNKRSGRVRVAWEEGGAKRKTDG